jgi:hypothetical protein
MTLRDYLYERLLFKSEYVDDFIISSSNEIVVGSGSYVDILESIRDGRLSDDVLDSMVTNESRIRDDENKLTYNIITIDMVVSDV